ncbi:LysR family transcriptional regulator [Streptosporangium lutulentum]
MELEIRHLRVICAIADHGSLTRAATALALTQPGLSAQLGRIEIMLGGRLFDRRHEGVTPTEFGEMVLTRARALLPSVDELLNTTATAARGERGTRRVRLGSVNAPLLGGLITAVEELVHGAQITSRAWRSPLTLVDDVAACGWRPPSSATAPATNWARGPVSSSTPSSPNRSSPCSPPTTRWPSSTR